MRQDRLRIDTLDHLKTVAIGGAGFIGSHIVKRFVDEGSEMVVADDFSRGSMPNLMDLDVGINREVVGLRNYGQGSKEQRKNGTN